MYFDLGLGNNKLTGALLYRVWLQRSFPSLAYNGMVEESLNRLGQSKSM